MFKRTFQAILFSIVVATGGLAASSTGAKAGNVTVDFSIGGSGIYFSSGRGYNRDRHRDYRYRDNLRRDYRRRDHRGRGYGRTIRRDRPIYDTRNRNRVCSPRRAYKKARRMGIRDARIVRINRRAIVIRGYRYGDRTKVRFGRGGRCPVIAVRSI